MSEKNLALSRYVSLAVRIQAERNTLTLTQVRERASYAPTTFNERLNGVKPWNAEDVDRLAKALGMSDGWELYAVARHEAELANGALY